MNATKLCALSRGDCDETALGAFFGHVGSRYIRRGILIDIASDGEHRLKHEPKGGFGPCVCIRAGLELRPESIAEPTFKPERW